MKKWEQMQDRKEEVMLRLHKLREAVAESAWKLREIEFTQLRPVEECLTDWAGLCAGLSHLRGEIEGMSPASAVAVVVVGLKAVRVLNRVIDTALKELLMQQSLLSGGLFLFSAGSGWAIVYGYWGTITKHLRIRNGNGNLEEGAEWVVQLIRNLKRLPAFFWYSSMFSCLVSLQMGQMLGQWSLRRIARSSAGTRLLQILGIAMFVSAACFNRRTEETVMEASPHAEGEKPQPGTPCVQPSPLHFRKV